MKYEQVKKAKATDFRRLTGVKPVTFVKMVAILKKAEEEQKKLGGKPNKLRIEERLLMTLEYLREYRTYFHISRNYGISESACYRNIRWVEDTLIKSREFSLPGKKALLKSDIDYELILVDASESPIQRPKKSSGITTRGKRSVIR